MELYEVITENYPELKELNFEKLIVLQDDSDGIGGYIREWNYSKPIPDGLKLGK
jgi:hypothetical protein